MPYDFSRLRVITENESRSSIIGRFYKKVGWVHFYTFNIILIDCLVSAKVFPEALQVNKPLRSNLNSAYNLQSRDVSDYFSHYHSLSDWGEPVSLQFSRPSILDGACLGARLRSKYFTPLAKAAVAIRSTTLRKLLPAQTGIHLSSVAYFTRTNFKVSYRGKEFAITTSSRTRSSFTP